MPSSRLLRRAATLLLPAVLLLLTSLSGHAALQGYWTFDNDYLDSSGNARPAAAGTTAPVFSTDVAPQLAGASARSLDMRSAGRYAYVPGSGPWFNFTGPATVSFWVKGWPTASWVPFISKNGEGSGWQVRRNAATNEADWTTRGSATGFASGNGDFATNGWGWGNAPGEASKVTRWQHLCATWDGTNKRIYINGQLAAVQANPGATIQTSTNLLVFGARDNGGFNSHSLVMLDNVAVWDQALTQAQIDDLSRGGSPLDLRTTFWPYGAGEPWGGNGTLGVRENKPTTVNGLGDVVAAMWNNVGTFSNSTAARLNFADPNSPGGALAGYTTYYSNTAVDDNNFGQVVTGCFRVPAGGAGQYTFYCNGDDGFQLIIFGATWEKFYNGNAQTTISGEAFQAVLPTGASNAHGVVTLQEGDYNFRYTWFEAAGGAFNYVQCGPGDKSATDATFKVLGDPSLFALVPQKPVLNFRTSADTITSGVPANITLSWDNKFTTALTMSPPPPGAPVLTPGKSSVTIPSPATTTTYTLTGTNGTQSTDALLTVFVDQPPVINSFAINDNTVVAGAPVTLSWNAVGAASLSIDNGVGSVTPVTTGTRLISAPAATTTYTLTATNGFGAVTAQVTVNIGPPPVIDSFTVVDANILPGGLANLNWLTSLATTVTLAPRPGSVAVDGNYCENPGTGTTYTLTATNVYASASQQVTVNMAGPLTITSAGWNQTRISSSTALAAPFLSMCDQLLAGTLTGTTFTQNGLAFINQGDGAVGAFPGGETLPPGGNGDNFLVRSTATLRIHFSGYYTLAINNDDGARLRIDGQDVIVDDVAHGPTSFTSGPRYLTAGDHSIDYLYFEVGGGFGGECYYIKPDGVPALLATNMPGPSAIPGTDLRLTEFCAANTLLEDAQADTPDWIEVHNPTAASIDLAGYYLTDSNLPAALNKWAFPAYSLPAGGYLVVFASGKNTTFPTNQFHTNFTLPRLGGYVALTKNGASPGTYDVVEDYTYTAQRENKSFGRYDLENYTGFFDAPSPGTVNSAGVDGFVGDTHFNVDRGIKAASFTLLITCDEPTAEVRYTTDGSPPTAISGLIFPPAGVLIDKTTVLRAAGFKKNWKPTNVDTQTYLFLDDVLAQTPANTLSDGWPLGPVAGQVLDYGMDSRVVTGNQAALKTALQSIPTLCISTTLSNLLHPVSGIYVDANQHGENWERPASVEYINDTYNGQTDGTGAFQIDCGLRIRGGYSRSDNNPKHAFRLFFQSQYDGDLNYPLFGKEGVRTFENIDLQTSQNYSWSFDPGTSVGATYQPYTFMREILSRDSMRAMGQPYTRSRYTHLYINGKYWGLYATQERPEANFGQNYLGGDEDNFDVVKSAGGSGGYNTEATDGTMSQGTSATPDSAWARLWWRARELRADITSEASRTTRYYAMQGLLADGITPSAGNPKVLNPENLSDYMLNSFYTGSFDAPMSTFLNNASNNWFGMKDRTANSGFVFLAHDHEHGMATDQDGRSDNRLGPWGGLGTNYTNRAMYNTGATYGKSNPAYIHEDVAFSLEYRVKFGDRAHRQLRNGGALTDAGFLAALNARASVLDPIIIAESARWGDSKTGGGTFYTKTDWLSAKTRLTNWINRGTIAALNAGSGPGRAETIITQLRAYKDKVSGTSTGSGDATLVAMPLYPLTDAPVFGQFGGVVSANYNLAITDPNTGGSTRTIYWRTDEQDPREIGGAIRAGSGTGGTVVLAASGVVKSRIFNSTTSEWSALTEALFIVGVPASSANLIVSEVNYNPRGPVTAPATDRDDYEFIELWNISATDTVQLDGVKFDTGITFDFTTQSAITSLAPGARCVVVAVAAPFAARYPDASYPGLSAKVAGVFTGKLDNGGEQIVLRNVTTAQDIANFTYDDLVPWPVAADGGGKTMWFTCTNSATADKNLSANWYEHSLTNGNPGGVDCGYELWALTNGASIDGLGDDDDDSLQDLVEYMLGASPAASSTDKMPTASVQNVTVGMDPPAAYATMTYTQAPLTPDIQVIAETATALSGWNPDAVLVSETLNLDGSTTRVFRAPLPFATDLRRQLRVRVVKP